MIYMNLIRTLIKHPSIIRRALTASHGSEAVSSLNHVFNTINALADQTQFVNLMLKNEEQI